MSGFRAQIRPLLLKELWLTRRSLPKSVGCYIVLPMFTIGMTIALAYMMFRVTDIAGHTSGQPTTTRPGHLNSLFDCGVTSSGCIIGLASNYTVYPGSTPLQNQQQVFTKWTDLVSNYFPDFSAQFISFNSSAAMEAARKDNSKLVLGLVLDASRYPHHVSYDIRIGSTSLPAPILPSRPSVFFPPFAEILGGASAFVKSGFTSFQVASDAAIATIIANDGSLSQLSSSTSPSKRNTFETLPPLSITISNSEWPTSKLVSAMMLLAIPTYLGWAYLGASYLIAHSIVEDRVSKLKEYLKIMGMKESSYWISYFIWCSILFSLPLFLLSTLSAALGFFGKKIFLGIVNVFLYGLSSVAFTMLAGSVAPSDTAVSAIVMIYFCVPFLAILIVNLALPAKVFLGIFSSLNFQFSFIQIIKDKAIWETGPTRSIPPAFAALPDYPTAPSIIMYLVDTVLYLFLAWYFGQILGGSEEYGGSPKKWYFLFTRAYWTSSPSKRDKSVHVSNDDVDDSLESDSLLMNTGPKDVATSSAPRDPAHFEAYSGDENNIRVRTRGLVKRYKGADVNAVNGLNLDVFQGIYVLLGENGSGKSTTISMLTGLIPITSGTASIDGANLETQLDQARDSISICPQHDLLSGKLTGPDHLMLFGRLKGVSDAELEARIPKLLAEVGLAGHELKLVSEYSGGMKRSLSLAVSLVANSRVVFIDEASSGMDMEKRRSLWDMLLAKKKEGLTLVLTTHYMEEAEILGDRIGIMHRGNLVREGTLDFLKKELGYQIHTSGPQGPSTQLLPISKRDELPALLKSLETSSSSVSVTTPNLEEVFVQLCRSLDTSNDPAPLPKYSGDSAMDSSSHVENPRPAPRLQQVSSLLKKKMRKETRSVGSWLCFLLLPIVVTALGLSFSRVTAGFTKQLPQAIASSQASDDPVWISLLRQSNLDIPYTTTSAIGSAYLNNMTSSGLKFSSVGTTVEELSTFFWNGTGLPNADLGGIFLAEFGHKSMSKTTYDYGIEFNQTNVYSVPALTNLMNNLIINHYLGLPANPDVSAARISVRSVPFQVEEEGGDLFTLKILSNNLVTMDTQFSYMVSIAFSILGGIIGTSIAGDYEKQIVYQLQRVGVPRWVFLTSGILFDFARFSLSSCLIAIVVAIFKVPILKGPIFGIFMAALLIQGWIAVLLSYLVSKLFSSQASAKKFLPLTLMIAVFVPNMIASVCRSLYAVSPILPKVSNYIALVSPLSLLTGVVVAIADAQALSFISKPTVSAMMQFNYAGLPFLALFLHFFILLAALVIIEKLKVKITTSPSDEKVEQQMNYQPTTKSVMDLPVALSEEDESDDHAVLLEQLWKRYPKAPRRAVVGSSLTVPNGICFGLLGPNGAGKSTTISMIIGDVSPSGGRYYLNGEDAIGSNRDDLYERVRLACCLQTDSLFDDLTVKEHIELYLSVRNHKDDYDEREMIRSILTRMKLVPHANKLAKQLSGGNKRKLCTAIAALIFTDIVILDEPSTGCDPSMRRTLWEVIKQEQSSKGLILTTHSMDEADAVCNRIAIMINGQVVSLGTTQALKAQCGGYELKIWLPAAPSFEAEQAKIHSIMTELLLPSFPKAQFIEKDTIHSGSICLKFDLGTVPLVSQAFDITHQGFVQGKYADYSVSQTTLGTAYQRLVRQQLVEDASDPKAQH